MVHSIGKTSHISTHTEIRIFRCPSILLLLRSQRCPSIMRLKVGKWSKKIGAEGKGFSKQKRQTDYSYTSKLTKWFL